MNKPLFGEKVAVLVANGFNEKELVAMQRMMQALGGSLRIISMTNGLVNSWNEQGWGLNFAADKALNEALAADFSMLLIPGGQKSAEKLKLTAHTRRFIGGFIDTGKPVVALGEAVDLLAFSERLGERNVVATGAMKAIAEAAGARVSENMIEVDANLMTAASLDEAGEVVAAIENFLVADRALNQAA